VNSNYIITPASAEQSNQCCVTEKSGRKEEKT